MKLALGLDVQTMPRGKVHRGLPSGRAGVQGGRGGAVEPGNFQDDGAKGGRAVDGGGGRRS